MTSSANLEQAFCILQAAIQDIRTRFNVAIPPTQPYSSTCPPVHNDGKCLLVMLLQNQWAAFCRDILEHSISGNGPTLGGNAIQPVILPDDTPDHGKYLQSTANRIARESFSNLGFPIWHNPEFVIRVTQELQPSNRETLELGISSPVSLRNLNTIRNYIVHGDDRLEEYERLLDQHGKRGVSPAEFLTHETPRGTQLFEDWLDEIVLAGKSAAA